MKFIILSSRCFQRGMFFGAKSLQFVVYFYHEKTQHQGRGMTLNEIQTKGNWIMNASKVMVRHINDCVICRRI